MWECVEVTQPTDKWAELDETGWDAVIGWTAGPHNLGRLPNSDAGRTVSVGCSRGGDVEHFEEGFTEDDRRAIDDSIDEFLADAGIPPRLSLVFARTFRLRLCQGISRGPAQRNQ